MLIKKEKKTIFCFKIRKINITYIKCKKYSAKRIKGKSINISSTYICCMRKSFIYLLLIAYLFMYMQFDYLTENMILQITIDLIKYNFLIFMPDKSLLFINLLYI